MKPNHQILIVDGNPNDVRAVRKVLESAGLAIHVRTDGSSAIEAFHAIKPDLVLIDTHVPETNGVQVSRELKQTDLGRTTPIILMSGRTLKSKERKQALSTSGCALLLQKPVTSEQMVEALSRFLPGAFVGGSRSASEAEPAYEEPSGESFGIAAPKAEAGSTGAGADELMGPEAFDEAELSAILDQVFPTMDSGPLAGAIAAKTQGALKAPKKPAFNASEESLDSLLDDLLPTAGDEPAPTQAAKPGPGAEAAGRAADNAAPGTVSAADAEIVERALPGPLDGRAAASTSGHATVVDAEVIDSPAPHAHTGTSPSSPAEESMPPFSTSRPPAEQGDSIESRIASSVSSVPADEVGVVAQPGSPGPLSQERGGKHKKKSKAARRERMAGAHQQSVQAIPLSEVSATRASEPEPAPLVAEQPTVILAAPVDRTDVMAYAPPEARPRGASRKILLVLLALVGAAAILYYLFSSSGESDLKPGASSSARPTGSAPTLLEDSGRMTPPESPTA